MLASLSTGHGNGRTERVKTVAEKRIVRRNEAPFVLADVVDFTGHIIVSSNNIDLALEEEALVADAQLIHRVQ